MANLRELLEESHRLGYLTEELATECLERAKRQVSKKWQIPEQAREEAISNFTYRLVRFWQKMNPEKQPASYLSAMISSSLIDVQRAYDRRRKKIERIENEKGDEFYEVFNSSTPSLDLIRMKAGHKSIIRRQIIQAIKSGVSKKELSRVTGIRKATIIKWHQLYLKHGTKFFCMDRRIYNSRPIKNPQVSSNKGAT